jgi:hypothetical protein
MLERGEEIEYKGKRGKVQYALFHGQEPVIIRWQNEEGSEEFEIPYDEVAKLKLKDRAKPKAKVKDNDDDIDETDTDVDAEGEEIADKCGKKKADACGKKSVNIFKRKTKKQ